MKHTIKGWAARKDVTGQEGKLPFQFSGRDFMEYDVRGGWRLGPIWRNRMGPDFWGKEWPPVKVTLTIETDDSYYEGPKGNNRF